jgi:hypothetical protein
MQICLIQAVALTQWRPIQPARQPAIIQASHATPQHYSWDAWTARSSPIVAQPSIWDGDPPRSLCPKALLAIDEAGELTAKEQMYLVRVLEALTGSLAIAEPSSKDDGGAFQIPADGAAENDLVRYTCNPDTGAIDTLAVQSMQHRLNFRLSSLAP